MATQFHPEKSGMVGLNFIKGFLEVSSYRLGYIMCDIVSRETGANIIDMENSSNQ